MRRVTGVAAVWGVYGAAPLVVPVCTAAVLIWRAGMHLEDRRQEVEEELRRWSERSAALPPFDWEPYRELVRLSWTVWTRPGGPSRTSWKSSTSCARGWCWRSIGRGTTPRASWRPRRRTGARSGPAACTFGEC